jgi:hypothetical protein
MSVRYKDSTVYELRQALLAIEANCQAFIRNHGDGFILAQVCSGYARDVLFIEDQGSPSMLCEDAYCTRPHGITRSGPIFVTVHVAHQHARDCPGGCRGFAFVNGETCTEGK